MKVIIVFFCALASVSSVRITNCNSRSSIDLRNIQISGCEGQRRVCVLHRGTEARMVLPFTPPYPVHSAKTVIHGILGPIPIPFPIPNNNACFNSGLHCPLRPNTPVVFHTSIPVKNEYPRIPVTVQIELLDEQGGELVCIKFPAIIR